MERAELAFGLLAKADANAQIREGAPFESYYVLVIEGIDGFVW